MREEKDRFLDQLGQPPARLSAVQLAWVLNCQPHDVPVLVAARLLKPLGNPCPNSVKYFCTLEILELSQNRVWLGKITQALGEHWRRRNLPKQISLPMEGLDGRTSTHHMRN
jgi:hypothetical protein